MMLQATRHKLASVIVGSLAIAFFHIPAFGAEAEPVPTQELPQETPKETPQDTPKDTPKESPKTATSDQPSKEKTITPGEAKKQRDKNADIFLPSERISEDYSVAFPADI